MTTIPIDLATAYDLATAAGQAGRDSAASAGNAGIKLNELSVRLAELAQKVLAGEPLPTQVIPDESAGA